MPAKDSDQPRDSAVSRRATTKEGETLAGLYREHAATVARWAGRLGGPHVDVEDILQEVFMVVHRQLASFRGDSLVTTWLFAITRNIVRQRLRSDRLRRFLLMSTFGKDGSSPQEQSSHIDDVERRESVGLVYKALSGLPEKYRTVFVLFEIEGLPGEEVVALTGLNISTLRVQLMRARALFMKRFERLENKGGLDGDH